MTKQLIEHTPGTANHFRLTAAGKEAKAAARRPAITDVHVDCVSWDRTNAAAGFTFGEHRYHIWFNPQTMACGTTLHKNPVNEPKDIRRSQHRALDSNAATNKPLLAEMWRQITERGMVAEALRMRAYEDVEEDAERDNRQFDLHRAFEQKAREALASIFKSADPAKIAPDYVQPIVEAMEWAQSQ